MAKLLIYHNGECNKCKEASSILQERGIEAEYKFYLFEPMTVEELREVHNKLNIPVTDMLRKTEPLYIEQYEGKTMTDDEWLQTIVDNSILLQRPIVINGDKAVIARPPGKVLEIL